MPHSSRDAVSVASHGPTTVITLVGEIDADLSAQLKSVAARAEVWGTDVEVEARDVTFMDSTGIGFLLRLRGAASSVRLVAPSPSVLFVLQATAVDSLFRITPGAGPDADA